MYSPPQGRQIVGSLPPLPSSFSFGERPMHKSNIDKVRIEVQLPQALVAQIDLLYLDPKLGRAKYGARSDLIQRLLEQHIKELQQHASLPGATPSVAICSVCGQRGPKDYCPNPLCASVATARQAIPLDRAPAGEVAPRADERAGSGRDGADGTVPSADDIAFAARHLP